MTHSLDPHRVSAPSALASVDVYELSALSAGWTAARSTPQTHVDATGIDALSWIPARVPGTAASALHDAGLLRTGEPHDFDAEDWWFRTTFDAQPAAPGEQLNLCIQGIATVAEVYLNGELILESDSMFATHTLDVTERLGARNELAVCCRALEPLLKVRRRPRARWRTSLVAEGNLRFFRTMLLGRLPGIAPGPAAVGPWRAVQLERRQIVDLQELVLRTHLDGNDGVLSVLLQLHPLDEQQIDSVELELRGPSGEHRTLLNVNADAVTKGLTAMGELHIRDVARWWPHTHGDPHLHDVRVHVASAGRAAVIDAGRVGFRDLAFGAHHSHDVEEDGLDLHVNGVRVFVRGAVWTPIDPIGLAPSEEELRAELIRVRDAGMNMLRIPGTGAYETPAFHDLCDELGILLWQDFMFANLDYPIADEHFRTSVTREAVDTLRALGAHPSLTVLCGNSEVEQQVAMMGLDTALGRGELFGQLLSDLVRESGVDAIYVPSAPCGGELPFRVDRGIGTYYGVGCYKLPLEAVRRADVRFAAECLAFSHVPAEETVEAMLPQAPGRLAGHHPLWKAGVPRENEADWDFEDIRDHYLRLLFGVDAPELRHVDRARYLELSRLLTGEILADVFGEWRRSASPCGGGLVLWLHDLLPGAGWGLIDHRGTPKLAYHHLKRALAPIAVWTVDEQLGGVVAHVANDGPTPLKASLRVALYREREYRVEEARTVVELEAHGHGEWNLETVIGHFLDVGWSYRFGPPTRDTVVVTLEQDEDERSRILSQTMRFPAGRPLERESPQTLGMEVQAQTLSNGQIRLTLSCKRLVYGAKIDVPGFSSDDDGFSIEPGGERVVTLTPTGTSGSPNEGHVSAVNMTGRLRITADGVAV